MSGPARRFEPLKNTTEQGHVPLFDFRLQSTLDPPIGLSPLLGRTGSQQILQVCAELPVESDDAPRAALDFELAWQFQPGQLRNAFRLSIFSPCPTSAVPSVRRAIGADRRSPRRQQPRPARHAMLGVLLDVGHECFEQFPSVRRGEILLAVFEEATLQPASFLPTPAGWDPFVPE